MEWTEDQELARAIAERFPRSAGPLSGQALEILAMEIGDFVQESAAGPKPTVGATYQWITKPETLGFQFRVLGPCPGRPGFWAGERVDAGAPEDPENRLAILPVERLGAELAPTADQAAILFADGFPADPEMWVRRAGGSPRDEVGWVTRIEPAEPGGSLCVWVAWLAPGAGVLASARPWTPEALVGWDGPAGELEAGDPVWILGLDAHRTMSDWDPERDPKARVARRVV